MNSAPHADGCQLFRAQLDAHLSGELAEEPSRQLQRHLENCPLCAAELEARASLRRQLQAAVRATPVPAGLNAKIRRAVRSGVGTPVSRDVPRRRTGLWAVAAAAMVILCVFLVGRLRVLMNPEQAILRKATGRLAAVLNVGLQDHLQCAVFRKYSKQPLPATQMAADLGPAFAGLAPLVQARLPAGFRIIQGHHCSAGGRQYTHLIVEGGGKILSVLLTRAEPGESLAGGIYQEGVDRFQVVGFESHDYLAYVISDLDPQQNLRVAANLALVVREFLAAHAG
jgi:anti-sigma factor RsiW